MPRAVVEHAGDEVAIRRLGIIAAGRVDARGKCGGERGVLVGVAMIGALSQKIDCAREIRVDIVTTPPPQRRSDAMGRRHRRQPPIHQLHQFARSK